MLIVNKPRHFSLRESTPEILECSPFSRDDKSNFLSRTLDSRFRGNDVSFKYSAPPRLCG